MPNADDPPLLLSDCLCPICREILLEPVTLPCNHTLCSPCFQSTVEKANLCCPMCRRRVSTWARHHARSKTLVNIDLWDRIQREFPVECQRRADGQDSQDLEEMCTSYPAPRVSKPGELRQEYELEVSKLEAERRAREEEESMASEALIQRLLEEEEAEQHRIEMRLQEQEEQLRHDERLAQMLSCEVVSIGESSCNSPDVSSPVSKPATTACSKSLKPIKGKPKHHGDIQRFLAPVTSGSVLSFFSSETGNGVTSREYSVQNVTANGNIEMEDDEMPVLSKQETFIPPGILLKSAVSNKSMPKLSPKNNTWVPGVLCPGQTSHGDLKFRLVETDLNFTKLPVVKTYRLEKICHSHSWDIKETSKRKSFEPSKETCLNLEEKRQRTLSGHSCSKCKEIPGNSESSILPQRQVDLEKDMYDRWKQEEDDRLLALRIQKELDKEMAQVDRKKGSPDGYLLRCRTSSSIVENVKLPEEVVIHEGEQQLKKPTGCHEEAVQKLRYDSPDENKKPNAGNRTATPARLTFRKKNSVSSMSPFLDGSKVLQSSNKQPTIVDMFQRSVAK